MKITFTRHESRKMLYSFLASLILMLTALFASCEKFEIDETSLASSEGNGNVVIRVQKVQDTNLSTPTTKAGDSKQKLSDICSRVSFVIFDGEEKIEAINQVSTDNNFGAARFNLDEGEYRLVVIAHNGKGNCNISLPEKIKFTNNKLTDTFYYYGRLEVTEDGAQTSISLQRAVGAFNLHINSENLPNEAKSIKFYYTGGSSTLDATTGYGCVNSRQTENFSLQNGERDFTVYTFPHDDDRYINMKVTLLDADAKELKTYTKADLKLKKNQVTKSNININESSIGGEDEEEDGGIGINFDPTWGETENVSFN